MNITIASKQQLPIIQDLVRKIWPTAYVETGIISEQQMYYMLNEFYSIDSLQTQLDTNHTFLLVEEDNNYIGFASYEINSGENGKTKLHKIYILPSTQGTGLGRLLLESVEKAAKNANNEYLFLNVNKYNNAKKFYEKLNFKIIAEEVIDIGQGYVMDDYIMVKKI